MRRRIIAVVLLVAILFTAFASISYADTKKETGLYKVDGKWKYYENGSFKKVTGLVKKAEEGTWHYVENGVYTKVTGLVKCVQPGSSKGKWYYVYKGNLNKNATGLVQCVQPGSSKGKWYYVEKGKLIKKAVGLVKCIQPKSKSKGNWYFVRKGKLDKTVTGVVTCVQPNSSSLKKQYYVEKGKLKKVTMEFRGTIHASGCHDGEWWYASFKYQGADIVNGRAINLRDHSAEVYDNGIRY